MLLFKNNFCYYSTIISIITERDAFDTLVSHAPDKLNVVKTVSNPVYL